MKALPVSCEITCSSHDLYLYDVLPPLVDSVLTSITIIAPIVLHCVLSTVQCHAHVRVSVACITYLKKKFHYKNIYPLFCIATCILLHTKVATVEPVNVDT